ncbi:hypothetical protein [Paenibacillus sp. UNC496MF]|uniref:hypothetical protein n=1 Tax=Paenibacillus sp. UNC496MF TaxID=1502753 RepID=UPI0035277697
MSLLGASLTSLFHPEAFQRAFGFFMLFMVILLLFRNRIKPYQGKWRYVRTPLMMPVQNMNTGITRCRHCLLVVLSV